MIVKNNTDQPHDIQLIFNRLKNSECSVVCFRLPGADSINLMAQWDKNEDLSTNTHFLFHPFRKNSKDRELKIYAQLWIRDHELVCGEIPPDSFKKSTPATAKIHQSDSEKQKYLNTLQRLIDLLNERDGLEKVVLSRDKWISKPDPFDDFEFFAHLCNEYPSAFVYTLSSPDTGNWSGASPETLISSTGDHLHTMALAGTRQDHNWSEKEKVEQKIVEQYIGECADQAGLTLLERKGPYSHRAGHLLHLRTDFKFDISKTNYTVLERFRRALHPTPAVCGYPKEAALDVIDEFESYERSYYTGYLGLIQEHSSDIFVNLRCMKTYNNAIQLFAGGGITSTSDATSEWEETEAKADTLLSVIEKMQNLAVNNGKNVE